MKEKDKKYQKHPLSLIPGGSTLEFTMSNGNKQIHNNIKYPERYIDKSLTENILERVKIISIRVLETGQIVHK